MNQVRIGLAIGALLIAAGCGGGGGDKSAGDPTARAPKLVELADACVLVNAAAEKELGATGIVKPEPLGDFARALDDIAEKTDARGQDAIHDLAVRARVTSNKLASATETSERLDAGLDMLNGYKRLQDSCQAVGAPLSVPSG